MVTDPGWHALGGLDSRVFLAINHAGGGWLWDRLALAGSAVGDHALYPVYAAAALALALKRPGWLSAQAVLAFLLAYLIDAAAVAAIKPWLNAPRPLSVLGPQQVHVLGAAQYWHGFPSGHSAFAWTIAAALSPGAHWVLRIALLLCAVWVAWSRIAVGAHFPLDVVAGALLGVLAAMLAARLLRLAGYPRR